MCRRFPDGVIMKTKLVRTWFPAILLGAFILFTTTIGYTGIAHEDISRQIIQLRKKTGNKMESIKYSKKFTLDQPIDALFPLYSAEGERLWVPGWDYQNIMGTTKMSEDYVFLTDSHDYASSKAIWLVKKYDPDNYFVEFYRIEPEDKVAIVTVKCTKLGKSCTETKVQYRYIGLGKKGNEFIAKYSEKDYAAFIEEWKELLVIYFNSLQ